MCLSLVIKDIRTKKTWLLVLWHLIHFELVSLVKFFNKPQIETNLGFIFFNEWCFINYIIAIKVIKTNCMWASSCVQNLIYDVSFLIFW